MESLDQRGGISDKIRETVKSPKFYLTKENKMATLLRTDGTKEIVRPKNEKEGFTLEEIRSLIGSDEIEVTNLYKHDRGEGTVFMDEEALLRGECLDPNWQATNLVRKLGFLDDEVLVFGDVLVCWYEEEEIL